MKKWASVVALGLFACVGDSNPSTDGGADAANDATVDAAPDVQSDAPVEAEAGVVTTYSDLATTSDWETFDLADAQNFGPTAAQLNGTAYAAGHEYMFSAGGPLIVSYDTSKPFSTKSSWAIYDTTAKLGTSVGFSGGVVIGQYLYVIPYQHQKVLQYDTTKPFASDTSWSVYDATSKIGGENFVGGATDGQYLYLVPYSSASVYTANVLRYNTQAPFGTDTSWENYDLRLQIDGTYAGYATGAYDGHYFYLAPYYMTGPTPGKYVAQYDTHSTFAAKSSWTNFDLTQVDANATGFYGMAYAAGHVYLAQINATIGGLALRYDTSKSFTTTGSWEKFDVKTVDQNAVGSASMQFDGRYVYWATIGATGTVFRYDTTLTFTDKASWQSFAVTKINPNAHGFEGMGFDGQYVYLTPYTTTTTAVAARFNAKTPPSIPTPTASFF